MEAAVCCQTVKNVWLKVAINRRKLTKKLTSANVRMCNNEMIIHDIYQILHFINYYLTQYCSIT